MRPEPVEPIRAKLSPVCAVLALMNAPAELAVEKSLVEVRSVQTAVATAAAVGAALVTGAFTKLAVERTDELLLVNAPPSWDRTTLPGLDAVVKSPAVVSVQTPVAIAAAVAARCTGARQPRQNVRVDRGARGRTQACETVPV